MAGVGGKRTCLSQPRQNVAAAWIIFAALLVCNAAATEQPLVRATQVQGVQLYTSRHLLQQQPRPASGRRRLSQAAGTATEQDNEHAHAIWLLGLPAHDQAGVHCSLLAQKCKLLHALPGGLPGHPDHHWIVHASEAAVRQLLATHPELTAGVLPPRLKLSPGLQRARQDPPIAAKGSAVLQALLPNATRQQLREFAHDVKLRLTARLDGRTVIAKVRPHIVSVSVPYADLDTAATLLAAHPAVTWVSLQPPHPVPYNLHAGAAVQAPERMDSRTAPSNLQSGATSGHFPYWAAGLDGRGQVVGVSDFGVDMDSCFLWDPRFAHYRNGSSTKRTALNPFPPSNADDSYADYVFDSYESTLHNVSIFQNTAHRKVVQLVMWGGTYDALGHGTHVAGTIAGSAYGANATASPNAATGIAPGARLAIMHLLGVDVDPGMLYDVQRQVGARITSNSYGPPGDSYYSYDATPDCFLRDAYGWAKQDMLHVIAAGNDGASLQFLRTTGTTAIPATCKNVLSVGATESWVLRSLVNGEKTLPLGAPNTDQPAAALGAFVPPKFDETVKIRVVDAEGRVLVTLVDSRIEDDTSASFGYMTATNSDEEDAQELPDAQPAANAGVQPLRSAHRIQIIAAKPPDACNTLEGNVTAGSSKGAVIMLVRKRFRGKTCSGATSWDNVRAAGAAGVMMYWDDDEELPLSGTVRLATTALPSLVLRRDLGRFLWSFLGGGTTDTGMRLFLRIDDIPEAVRPIDTVAYFSAFASEAPVSASSDSGEEEAPPDVRIKPEVVAPGYLLSAASDFTYSGRMDQCDVVYRDGTSMATPVVAGAAAIARQYFIEGWYPSGAPSNATKHAPSAALLKAVLISGAAALRGFSRIDGERLAPPPSAFQGFGRVDLSASLPLAGDARGWRLQIVDGADFQIDGLAHNYTVTVPSQGASKPLIVTLAWADFPAYPGLKYVLVNNLDLRVQGPGGRIWWGNGVQGGDHLNNVERVAISTPPAGNFTLQVRAAYLFSGARPQSYALVVLGGFEGTLDSPANPARFG